VTWQTQQLCSECCCRDGTTLSGAAVAAAAAAAAAVDVVSSSSGLWQCRANSEVRCACNTLLPLLLCGPSSLLQERKCYFNSSHYWGQAHTVFCCDCFTSAAAAAAAAAAAGNSVAGSQR
jgi:hypothetical protein